MAGLQFDRLTVTGRGKARFALCFVDESAQIVAEGTLVTVSEGVDFGVVDFLHRVAVQLPEARFHAALLRLVLRLLQFLPSQLVYDRRALLRSLAIPVRIVDI